MAPKRIYWTYHRMDGDDNRCRPLSVLWLMLILLGTFFFIINVFQIRSYEPMVIKNVRFVDRIDEDDDDEDEEHYGFFIKTNGCRINEMEPYHETIMKFLDNNSRPELCNKGLPSLVDSNRNRLYMLNVSYNAYSITNVTMLNCCYRPFWRLEPSTKETDHKVKYSDKCISITIDGYTLVNDEFVKVTCNYNDAEIYKEFFSFVQLKNQTAANSHRNYLNVLLIGIDSISRLNLIRTMPKTVAYLHNISAYEFLGYNKVADNTFPNLVPLLTGLTVKDIEERCWINNSHFDNCPFVWKLFKEKNYTTAFAEDSSWMGTFNYVKYGFHEQPTDYYWNVFNYVDEKEAGNQHKMNVYRCVGPKMVYKKLIDYNKRFVHVMEENNFPYFGFFWGASLSHDFLNYPTIGDDDYYNLLKEFNTNGYFDNTALIFMSDHGMRFGNIRSTYQGMMEERLPFLYIKLPYRFLKTYQYIDKNLRKNLRRLTTHFDLHETLLDLLNHERLSNVKDSNRRKSYSEERDLLNETNVTRKSYSLFDKIPNDRTCTTAGIDEHWCTCQSSVEIDNTKKEVLSVTNFAIDYINDMLSLYEDCVNLTLSNITSARLHTHSEHMKYNSIDYTIIFSTKPNDALFEATIRYNLNEKNYNVIGTISRINLYGEQSHCVANFEMKLYCYCKNFLHAK